MKRIIKNIFFSRHLTRKFFGSGSIGVKTKIHPLVSIDRSSTIGNYTYIAKYTLITSSKIGNYCSIAPNVKIGLGEHNYLNFSTNVLFVATDVVPLVALNTCSKDLMLLLAS